jgi:hypothetical protein
MRALRELEPPADDEGFAGVELMAFARTPAPGRTRAGVIVATAALRRSGWEAALEEAPRDAPHLVLHWEPGTTRDALAADVARLEGVVPGAVESALCPHPAGPPTCWCRPPLPALPLAFARAHDLDLGRSLLVGVGAAHRTLATSLGARYVEVGA